MKQVVLNLGQSNHRLDKPSEMATRYSIDSRPATTIKNLVSGGLKKSSSRSQAYAFEPAERDDNVHKPLPTEFVRFLFWLFTYFFIALSITYFETLRNVVIELASGVPAATKTTSLNYTRANRWRVPCKWTNLQEQLSDHLHFRKQKCC